ncbi:hypothetical protein PsorP6_008916 [Peronosclerospora sorghi]|uniref:Uncharacterized protein n=1 Tax=Peronosclerospora sorghi TaxID=230839 RepID=A0ACC0W1T8_9STRA|nr:hypothetical protein PsorP6_008916 [Peronosclerospora sorghi]
MEKSCRSELSFVPRSPRDELSIRSRAEADCSAKAARPRVATIRTGQIRSLEDDLNIKEGVIAKLRSCLSRVAPAR